MYVKRDLELVIRKNLDKKEIIAVIGPRQSGKSSLLKNIFKDLKDAIYLDFEDRETLELFNEDIKGFVELYVKPYKYLFIDEFQYSRDGGKQLKYIYDTHNIKILISGSSATGLSIHGIKYLVGRIFVFNLYPFSFQEFLSYKDEKLCSVYVDGKLSQPIIEKILPHFKEFCLYGGYPRVVISNSAEEKETVLTNIYNTYFLKEIKEILNLPEDHKLSKLIKALSLQIGNMINYNELSGISGFNNKELLNYVNILEKTFIVIRSQPYYTNRRTELVKTPKIFFLDNGFRNVVLKEFQLLSKRVDKGMLYENFVASELMKKGIEFNYWRTKSKAEVDFIVKIDGILIPIEIKSENPSITKSYSSFIQKYNPKKCYVLSEKVNSKKANIFFKPIFSLSNEISKL